MVKLTSRTLPLPRAKTRRALASAPPVADAAECEMDTETEAHWCLDC